MRLPKTIQGHTNDIFIVSPASGVNEVASAIRVIMAPTGKGAPGAQLSGIATSVSPEDTHPMKRRCTVLNRDRELDLWAKVGEWGR